MALGLTDLRSWLAVLQDAVLMRPRPAVIVVAPDDKELDGYIARLAALLVAVGWLIQRLDRTLVASLRAPLESLRAMPAVMGPDLMASLNSLVSVLDEMQATRRTAAEGNLLIPSYVIDGLVEAVAMFGVVLLVTRFLRPAPPARAAAGACLSALVSSALYAIVLGWLTLQLTGATGLPAAASAVQAASSDTELQAALRTFLNRLFLILGSIGLISPMPLVSEGTVLFRALRAFGARRGVALLGAIAAVLLSWATATLAEVLGILRFLYLLAAG